MTTDRDALTAAPLGDDELAELRRLVKERGMSSTEIVLIARLLATLDITRAAPEPDSERLAGIKVGTTTGLTDDRIARIVSDADYALSALERGDTRNALAALRRGFQRAPVGTRAAPEPGLREALTEIAEWPGDLYAGDALSMKMRARAAITRAAPEPGAVEGLVAGLRKQVEIGADTQTREAILRMLDKIATLAAPIPSEPDR